MVLQVGLDWNRKVYRNQSSSWKNDQNRNWKSMKKLPETEFQEEK